MANDVQILDKIQRNLEQASISVTRTGTKLEAGNIKVQYEAADIQSPMGGVDDSASPFLGIGTANPGKLIVSGLLDADSTIASIFVDATDLRTLRICTGIGNTIIVRPGETTDTAADGSPIFTASADLAVLEGHVDLLGMGQ